MVIPWDKLPAEVLTRVIEEFVTRGGTDDGHIEHTLESRVAEVRAQLQKGEARVVYDPETETVSIVPRR